MIIKNLNDFKKCFSKSFENYFKKKCFNAKFSIEIPLNSGEENPYDLTCCYRCQRN